MNIEIAASDPKLKAIPSLQFFKQQSLAPIMAHQHQDLYSTK